MNRNPYAAPKTVADAAESRGPPPRPVRLAVQLLWIGVAISVGAYANNFRFLGERMGPASPMVANAALTAGLITAAVTILLSAWIISRIAAGRNWARWLLLVLLVIGLLGMLLNGQRIIALYSMRPSIGAFALINWVLNIIPCFLLFTPRATAWFKADPNASAVGGFEPPGPPSAPV